MFRFLRRVVFGLLSRFGLRSPLTKALSFIPVHHRQIATWRPDIVHAHDLYTLPLAAKVAKEVDAKLIFDSHELEVHRNPPLSLGDRLQVQAIEKTYLPKCDAVTTVSESIAIHLEEQYGLGEIETLVNSPPLRPSPSNARWEREKRYNLRADAGLSKKDFALLYVGLVTVNRGLEIVLEALSELPERFKLVTLGPVNRSVQSDLLEMAREFEVADRFIMLDPVNPPDVSEYARTADAAVLPTLPLTLSYEFSLPNKLFECTFAGLPLIASDLPEMERKIIEFGLGVSYEAYNPSACAEAIRTVARDRSRFTPNRESLKRFIEQYCWEAQGERLLEVYKEISPTTEQVSIGDSSTAKVEETR